MLDAYAPSLMASIWASTRSPTSTRGGVSTKIYAVTTTQGRPLHVTLTQGHRHEATKAEELVEHARGKACIADSGYYSRRVLDVIRAKGMKPVIAPNGMRAVKPRLDRKLYALRYRVECGFHARYSRVDLSLFASERVQYTMSPRCLAALGESSPGLGVLGMSGVGGYRGAPQLQDEGAREETAGSYTTGNGAISDTTVAGEPSPCGAGAPRPKKLGCVVDGTSVWRSRFGSNADVPLM